MPVRRQTYETLHAQTERLATELATFEEMRPHLALAYEIRDQIIELIDASPDLTAAHIGDLAFKLVLEKEVEAARDEVVAKYEQAHRRSLYEQLIQEVETTEGSQILAEVRQRVETDPELALELRESARRELAARADEVIKRQITAEQAEIISKDAERQIELDRLDVELAVAGRLDLSRQDIVDSIRPGDKVHLFYEDDYGDKQSLILVWTKDIKSNQGWLYEADNVYLYDADQEVIMIDEKRFVTVGSLCIDYQEGMPGIYENLLVMGAPLVLIQYRGQRKKIIEPHVTNAYYDIDKRPVRLIGSDFQTRNLHFN